MERAEQTDGAQLVAQWRGLLEESERRLERFHAILTSGAAEAEMNEQLNAFIKGQTAAEVQRREAISKLAAHADQLSQEERNEMIELHERSENLSRRSLALFDAIEKAGAEPT